MATQTAQNGDHFVGYKPIVFFLCVEHFSKVLVSTVCISTAILAICLQVLCLWIHPFFEFIGSLQLYATIFVNGFYVGKELIITSSKGMGTRCSSISFSITYMKKSDCMNACQAHRSCMGKKM